MTWATLAGEEILNVHHSFHDYSFTYEHIYNDSVHIIITFDHELDGAYMFYQMT